MHDPRAHGSGRRSIIGLPTGAEVWLVAGVTDMPHCFDSLAAAVQFKFARNPCGAPVFGSRGRRGHRIKLLWGAGDALAGAIPYTLKCWDAMTAAEDYQKATSCYTQAVQRGLAANACLCSFQPRKATGLCRRFARLYAELGRAPGGLRCLMVGRPSSQSGGADCAGRGCLHAGYRRLRGGRTRRPRARPVAALHSGFLGARRFGYGSAPAPQRGGRRLSHPCRALLEGDRIGRLRTITRAWAISARPHTASSERVSLFWPQKPTR